MISQLHLIRSVGRFDHVNPNLNVSLSRLVLIYAENGRGKTTLAAILRSLGSGDPLPIAERQRLTAAHPPQVVLDCTGGPTAVFRNNTWNRTLPEIIVFDDIFVDHNICSGLEIAAGHRQKLHEFILGARGVALNRSLQLLIEQVEAHNKSLRAKGEAFPRGVLAGMSVDAFCALPQRDDIDAEILATERNLAAAREQESIKTAPLFDALSLPGMDTTGLETLLLRDLPDLNAEAAAKVQKHLSRVGANGEAWIAQGMEHLPSPGQPANCPFCAQDLAPSMVIHHYRAYFSAAYAELKDAIANQIATVSHLHGGDSPAAFERAVRISVERRQFWSSFCDLPEIALDTAEVARAWRAAREAVLGALRIKQGAPLEHLTISSDDRETINTFEHQREAVKNLNLLLQKENDAILIVKEQAAVGNPVGLASHLEQLKAVKARHTPDIDSLCDEYLAELAAKVATEQARNAARAGLDQYRQNIFPGYQIAMNEQLRKFNAGWSLGNVTAANTRGGSACIYDVMINNSAVSVSGAPVTGTPSFRTTLSAGDRNTLALSFFFASLDQDANIANKIVIIDDPLTSLDEHRTLNTVQEIIRLTERVQQVIVLSHDRSFLCRIWERANSNNRVALEVVRDGDGSTINLWDVSSNSITEHDYRHKLMREYLATNTNNQREIARSIRPTLEAYFRVACPEHFQPGTLLGPFRNICQQRVGTPQQILGPVRINELRDLSDYANRFHHDTNPAWETEAINDQELTDFVTRTLKFTSAQ